MDSIFNTACLSSSTECSGSCSSSSSSITVSGTSADAFGRLRVSNPFTLFDSQNRYKQNDKFNSNILGASSNVTFSNVESTVLLNVSASSGSYASRESKYVFSYQPGKSLLVLNTFVMSSPLSNLVQRVGYFGVNNGYFLQLSGSTASFVERSNAVDTVVTKSAWNVDLMDGTGPSKVILDLTKSQILFTDIEWLGVGSVRMGFVINGTFWICHVFHHANILAKTYMTTACLPIRYEIFNSGVTTASSTMRQICSSIISEGGYEPKEQLFCALSSTSALTLSSLGTQVPLCTIRLSTDRLDAIARLKQVSVSSSSNNDLARWTIVLNGTLTGATYAETTDSTNVQVDTAATAISGGRIIQAGFAQTGAQSTSLDSSIFEGQLGRNSYLGTSDTLTLCATGLTLNAKIYWILGWTEVI